MYLVNRLNVLTSMLSYECDRICHVLDILTRMAQHEKRVCAPCCTVS